MAPPRDVSCHSNAYGRASVRHPASHFHHSGLRVTAEGSSSSQECCPLSAKGGPGRPVSVPGCRPPQQGDGGRQGTHREPPCQDAPRQAGGGSDPSQQPQHLPCCMPQAPLRGQRRAPEPQQAPSTGRCAAGPSEGCTVGHSGGHSWPHTRPAAGRAKGAAGGASLHFRAPPAAAGQGDGPQGCAQG